MGIITTYPLFTVEHLDASKDFLVRSFGLEIAFEAKWVAMLSRPGSETIQLGLMSADHPSHPPGPETFGGLGAIWTIQVDDVATLHAHLTSLGAPIVHPLTVEPWGQRRFMVRDPSNLLVDVVEQIEPKAGFWEQYC